MTTVLTVMLAFISSAASPWCIVCAPGLPRVNGTYISPSDIPIVLQYDKRK